MLILGSMPGEESLRQQQYYAHPRNQFWPIICEILSLDMAADYQARTQALIDHGIALWDVIGQCRRQGSLDTSIVAASVEVNDFASLLSEYDSIEHIFFNGRKAESEFNRRVLPGLSLSRTIHLHLLPSTSPAHAGMSRADKLLQWSQIKQPL